MTEWKFGDIFSLIKNGTPSKQNDNKKGVPITRIETISHSIIDPTRVGYIEASKEEYSRWLLKNGDLLFSHINSLDHIGKCAIYSGIPETLVHGINLLCLRPRQDILDSKYAAYLIRSKKFRTQMARFVNRSVNQASISTSNLKKLTVDIPTLDRQRHIAEILDRADALRAKRREAIACLDELAQSIFLDMFGDPVNNPKNWPRKTIASIAQVLTGNTPPRSDSSNYGGDIEWIKSDNISTQNGQLTAATEFLSERGMKTARTAPAGALLMTCIAGSPTSIGNVAVADRRVAFNQQINAIINSILCEKFMYMQLKIGKRLIQEKSTGGMKGIVSKSRLESVSLMCPPEAEQKKFDEHFRYIESSASRYSAQHSELEDLFAALQQRAFRGDL